MNFAQKLRKEINEEEFRKKEEERLKREESTNRWLKYEKIVLMRVNEFKDFILKYCLKHNTGKLVINSETFPNYEFGFDTGLLLEKAGEKLKQDFIKEGFRVIHEYYVKIGGRYNGIVS